MNKVQDRIMEKASRARLPIIGSFELLPMCNLRCKMCYVRKDAAEVRAAGGLKDADWWLALAESATREGLLFPLITGGEPFLHPKFDRILKGMLDLGLQVSINTNGTLIDGRWADFLNDHRPTRINLTLYGASDETYDRLCGDANAFTRVQKAVDLLLERGIRLKFNTSITPDNVDDLPAMIAFAKDRGCPIQVATYMFPPLRRDSSLVGQNDRLSPEDAALARVRADLLQADPAWFVGQALTYRKFVPLDQEPWNFGNTGEVGMTCRAGLSSFWVDWQGALINCGMYASVRIQTGPETFAQDWRTLVEQTAAVRYSPACLSCLNRPICHPCIAMIQNECGTHAGRPEYMCRMNAALSRYYDTFVREHYPDVVPQFDIPQEMTDSCEI
jgi:radical SAM protein with 4Fe4S-binding SPASM domain